MVFLFVVHPFDIGDSLVVEGETYKVARVDLHYTTL